MQIFRLRFRPNPAIFPLFCCSSSSLAVARCSIHSSTSNSDRNPGSTLSRFLIDTFSFTEQRALDISKRFQWVKSAEKPESMVQFLEQFGFSSAQIRSSVHLAPQILFMDVDKVIKPKLEFFQQLGLTASDLGNVVSKNPNLVLFSLENKLIPIVSTFMKIMTGSNGDVNSRDWVRVLRRSYWFTVKDAHLKILPNIAVLESCKITGSQLSSLLKSSPNLFFLEQPILRQRVSCVLEMGVSIDSKMFCHALYTVCGMSAETLNKKLELFRSFGFSEDECMGLFRRHPNVFRSSEERLKYGIKFFFNLMCDFNFDRSLILSYPIVLSYSMKERVIPRVRVLHVIKSKRLSKREPSLSSALAVSENVFLDRYILKYRNDVEELLMAYKSNFLDSSH